MISRIFLQIYPIYLLAKYEFYLDEEAVDLV